ncbi:thiamine pyrophosphate-binding protein [Tardiphaga sp. vice352]|uniref:thiamine pyrophosphate-binding protein n=1 Tax=Tardiphaga sp. vice352 TaxID=2592816 RepID=UPI001164ACBA|nr:thiamine pyrophosphate-binding protein [Tardiphaga sp. vice352]QDM33320.1 thiamine pyrophosphate-binding protein [Tardiphaga sp. vice352]
MTGAEYIAEFLARIDSRHVFTLTGGACAFMIDAVGRHPALDVICVQNEQAAAMAADAVWRVDRRMGVSMATSGPGATNLITGIACSFFDSIPSLHITGQVNQRESSAIHGANVRQSGFQETKIVEMVRPITKYAVLVTTVDELRDELAKCYVIAMSGRMGPVLIDVPMDIQQAEIEPVFPDLTIVADAVDEQMVSDAVKAISDLMSGAERPVVVWGGGVAMADVKSELSDWLARSKVPFVASWAGLSAFSHDHPGFIGQIGVYGNRGANFVLQNADAVLVLGSRLDNRQRSGNADNFAIGAKVHVLDVDAEEIKKYGGGRYSGTSINLKALPAVLDALSQVSVGAEWRDYVSEMQERYRGCETSSTAKRLNSLSPYDVVRHLSEIVADDAIVAGDTGAAICWLHQSFNIKKQNLFTAGGNSPMGYALCAAIGAKLAAPDRQVISYNGDGGLQVNIQELQTIKHLGLDVAIVVMNNGSYGIIKQFQDSYMEGRYTASQDGYSTPDFGAVARAYGLDFQRVEKLSDLTPELFGRGPILIEVMLSDQTLIEPKLEMGRPINDQYPYLPQDEYERGNRFVAYPRPAHLHKLVGIDG